MGYKIVDEIKNKRSVNRWLELKNDETRSPNQKLDDWSKRVKISIE